MIKKGILQARPSYKSRKMTSENVTPTRKKMTETEKSQKKMKNESILSNLYEINHRRLNSFKRSKTNSSTVNSNVSPATNRKKPKRDNKENANKENCKSQIRNSRSFSSRKKDIDYKPQRMKTQENECIDENQKWAVNRPLFCKEDQLFIKTAFEKNYDFSKFQTMK